MLHANSANPNYRTVSGVVDSEIFLAHSVLQKQCERPALPLAAAAPLPAPAPAPLPIPDPDLFPFIPFEWDSAE
jgi:hypothetical protein